MMIVNKYDYFYYLIYCINRYRRVIEFINNIFRIIFIFIIGLYVFFKLIFENNFKIIIRKRKFIFNLVLIYIN